MNETILQLISSLLFKNFVFQQVLVKCCCVSRFGKSDEKELLLKRNVSKSQGTLKRRTELGNRT